MSMVALKATLPLPLNDIALAVISPLILKFLDVSNIVALAALPVISLEVRATVPVTLGKVNVLSDS